MRGETGKVWRIRCSHPAAYWDRNLFLRHAHERGKIMRRRFLAIYLLGLLPIAAVAAASDAPAFFGAGLSCVSSSDLPFTQPQPGNRDSCFEGPYCDTDQDCANRCSGFATATCIENDCHHTYGSPGGGSGGGGYHSQCFSNPAIPTRNASVSALTASTTTGSASRTFASIDRSPLAGNRDLRDSPSRIVLRGHHSFRGEKCHLFETCKRAGRPADRPQPHDPAGRRSSPVCPKRSSPSTPRNWRPPRAWSSTARATSTSAWRSPGRSGRSRRTAPSRPSPSFRSARL